MSVILAAPASAAELVSNLDQRDSVFVFNMIGSGYAEAQKFSVGNSDYFLEKAVVKVNSSSTTRNPSVSIRAVGSDSNPGNTIYNLTGSITSTGHRDFTAPASALLKSNTDYFLFAGVGDGTGSFSLTRSVTESEDPGAAPGWSIANNGHSTSGFWSLGAPLKLAIHGRVKPANVAATGRPTIRGIVSQGAILTVDTSGISDANGMDAVSFTYQWIRVGSNGAETNIPGATGRTYTPVSSDLRSKLKVKVSFTDDHGYDEGPFFSDVTIPVLFLLVGNINQGLGVSGRQITDKVFVAQEFTTGNHSNGYNVSMVVVKIEDASSTRVPVISIYSSDGAQPVSKLYEFNGSVSETGDRHFVVPGRLSPGGGVTLSPNTSYFVHIAGGSGSGSFRIRPGHGDSAGFDSNSLPGWSVSRSHRRSDNGGSSWSSRTGFNPRFSVLGVLRSSPLPDVNTPPVFSGDSNFLVEENSRDVGTVVASDPDSQDDLTGYSLSGGADRARFSITGEGVLSFKSAPNFESPSDSGRDNEYVFDVKVTSGSSGRERFSSKTFTVNVTDMDEHPSVPGAPGLTPLNSTSLFVSWDRPGNTGPSIIDYDVGYSVNSSGPFEDWSHSDASRSTTITGLNANTLYFVRVLARNAEGASGWSRTAYIATDSANPGSINSNLLVSNINQNLGVSGRTVTDSRFVAQEFTTGNHSNGYSVSKIVVKIEDASSTRVPVISIYSSSGGQPGVKFYEFNGSVTGTGNRDFTVPVGVTLGPNTSYFVHIAGGSGSGSFRIRPGHGDSAGFDSNSLPGWSVSRSHRRSDNGGSSWFSRTGFNPRFSVWGAERSGSVPDVNTLPFFSGESSFSVNENSRDVGTVVASDGDSRDNVTGYTVSGGVDRTLFSITSGGVLTFVSAPDYENPSDNGGNNVYNIVVTATSGTGSRVRTATQTITVTVTDVSEAPSVINSPPSFTSSSAFSVDENVRGVGTVVASDSDSGDSVSGYSVSGGVDSSLFEITNSGVLTFLSAPDYESPSDNDGNNVYNIVVTATSGTSGRVRTATQSIAVTVTDVSEAPSVITNNPPSFTSSSSFSVSENSRNVGTVVASDSDSQDSVTGYSVSSGVDRNLFSITSGGVLTFRSAPDFESPADNDGNNVYNIVVTATSGTSGRVRTATQTITVTVTDVSEAPSVINNPPSFTSSSSFSVQENGVSVGTVVASDSDSGDSVTGYSVSGGVDRALFSITSGGVLTFRSAPDFESPADNDGNNVYNIVVTATSGTSGRVRTATQTITVTVTNVSDGPMPPKEVVLVYKCV